MNEVKQATEQSRGFNAFIGVRLAKAEKEVLERFASSEQVTISQLIREAIAREISRRMGVDHTVRP